MKTMARRFVATFISIWLGTTSFVVTTSLVFTPGFLITLGLVSVASNRANAKLSSVKSDPAESSVATSATENSKGKTKGKAKGKSKGSADKKDVEILFEGYSKILSGGVHIGFTVIRYSFDSNTGHFKSQYFLKTGKAGNDISESYIAEADQNFVPISYTYTSLMPKETRTVDATFAKGNMRAKVTLNGKTTTVTKKIPKGTFLSTFLIYVMMKQPEGLQTNNKYEYKAIAEEDADVTSGTGFVEKATKFGNFKVFKINNKFKDVMFHAYVSDRGEVVATESPTVAISTELVAKASDATTGFSANASTLKAIFGEVPLGTKNVAYEALQASATAPADLPATPDGPKLLQKPSSDTEIKK